MPLYTNTERGTVRYSPSTWETKILENDLAVGSATLTKTTGLIDALSIPIGQYERVIGTLKLFYSSSDANELRVSFNNVDSDNEYIATIIRFSVFGILKATSDEGILLEASGDTSASGTTVVSSTTGHGLEARLDAGNNSDPLAATINFTAIGNAAKSGTFNFQASGLAGNPSLLAGSYLTYKKF
tara:strand:- start:52 stop:606 length:555 start_codon:yes stop_codon:yes gene_type:complete